MKAFFAALFPLCGCLSTAVAADETLTLSVAMERALRQNQSIVIRDLGREVAAGELTRARGSFDPRLQVQRKQSKDETPTLPGGGSRDLWTDEYQARVSGYTPWGMTYELGAFALSNREPILAGSSTTSAQSSFALTQPLLKGFGTSTALQGLRIAKANQRIADWEFKQAAIDTVTAVIVAYNDVLEARENLRISSQYRANVRALAAGHQKRLEIGSLAEADVANAQSRAAQIEESVLFAEQGARDAEQRLRRLMGESSFEGASSLVLEPLAPSSARMGQPSEDLRLALESRPDIQAARQGVKKAEILRTVARQGLLPSVDLVASYGYGDLDVSLSRSRRSVLDREYRIASAGVVVTVPLTLTEARGIHRSSRAQLRQRETEVASLEADIALAVDRTARTIRTAEQRVASLEQARQLAQRSLEAEDKRFRAGTGNTFFVLQQQGELAGVEGNLNRARRDLARALAYYDRELGRTLERQAVTQVK